MIKNKVLFNKRLVFGICLSLLNLIEMEVSVL